MKKQERISNCGYRLIIWVSSVFILSTSPGIIPHATAQTGPFGNVEDHFTFEAENWNFDSGQFIDNPNINYDPFDPNSYVDKGAVVGVPGVDYQESDPTLRFETDEWRIPLDAATIGLPQTLISEDEPRTQYINVAIDEYDVTETANGE